MNTGGVCEHGRMCEHGREVWEVCVGGVCGRCVGEGWVGGVGGRDGAGGVGREVASGVRE